MSASAMGHLVLSQPRKDKPFLSHASVQERAGTRKSTLGGIILPSVDGDV